MKNVRLIELELFGYCNRRCSWCPNKFIDRQSSNFEMDIEVFEKIIQELKEMDYQGVITFSRYNEPMSLLELLNERVSYIRKHLPNVKLVMNTNGDFLNRSSIKSLDIDELSIMDYDNHGAIWCDMKLSSINCVTDSVTEKFIYAHYNDMKVLYALDWSRNNVKKENTLDDRGGIMKDITGLRDKRTKPCMEPTYFIGIDYNGSVVPCCNIRSDYEGHTDYILGNVKDKTLSEIYNTLQGREFRTYTQNGIFAEGSPCEFCQKNPGRYTKDDAGIEYKESE